MQAHPTRFAPKKHASGDGKRRRKRVSWRDEHGELAAQDPWEFHGEKARRVWRARAAKKAKRKRWGSVPLSRELAMLAVPTNDVEAITKMACETTNLGLEWAAQLLHTITHACFRGGRVTIEEHAIRKPNSSTARGMLGLLFRVIADCTRHRDEGIDVLSVRGQKAYWGRQAYCLNLSEEEIDHRHAMACADAEHAGKKDPPRFRVNWAYLPRDNEQGRHQQKGHAARSKRCVRTVGRWLRAWKLAGVMESFQPKAFSKGAVMPRVGKWAYPEIKLMRALPESLMKRLQRWWGEKRREGDDQKRRGAGEPAPRTPDTLTVSHTGPPKGRRDAVAPWYDSTATGLSPTELDDLEQLVGF